MNTFDKNLARSNVLIDGPHSDLLRLYRLAVAYPSVTRLDDALSELSNKIGCGEFCEQCVLIFCYYGEPLHNHHDGCPSCSMEVPELTREQWYERMRQYHGVTLVLS